MIIPSTYAVALMLTIISMICWGSWANTQKLAGKWRFELFYIDYSIGVLVAAVVAAFTFGMLGSELNFEDNLSIVGKRPMVFCFAAGVIFNLANMLLVAAISIAGMAVAFPIGIGLALVIGVIWSFLLNPQGNPWLLFAGAALYTIVVLIIPLVARRAINDVVDRGHTHNLRKYIVMLGVLGVLRALGGGIRKYQATKNPALVANDIRDRLFAHVQRMSFSFHDEIGAGPEPPREPLTHQGRDLAPISSSNCTCRPVGKRKTSFRRLGSTSRPTPQP